MYQDNFIVFTGGPGAGKTSVINELKARGFCCAAEVSRQVIQAQVEAQSRILPWIDKEAFAHLVLEFEISSYQKNQNQNHNQSELIFFDRSLVDILGFFHLDKMDVTEALQSGVDHYKYHSRVFLFPPWEDIYANDSERKEDFDTAIRFYNALVRAYEASGYELIKVPFGSVSDRASFVLSHFE